MAKIDQLFKIMWQQNASDLHLAAGNTPYLRMHGDMMKLAMKPLSNEEVQSLIFEILSEKQKRQFIENWELDCSYTIEGLGRYRCNIFMQRRGMGAVFRMIPEKMRSAEELGLPQEVMDLIKVPKGLILVTGPTGSGKSTTLAAMMSHIADNEPAHIITIEDPIEFVYRDTKALVNQREVGGHTKSFANALKAALREDPDIILVGEMRDLETIQLAITAAETGHLVFGTLHTSSAAKTVDRIIDVFPDSRQAQIRAMLSESLRGVVAQSLLPRKDGSGRCAAIEVMTNSKAIANLIRDGKTFQIPSTMQIARSQGCITYDAAIEALIAKGMISTQVGMEFLGKPVPAGSTDEREQITMHNTGVPPQRESQVQQNSSPGIKTAMGTAPRSGMPSGPQGPQQPPTSTLGNLANRFKKTS